MDFLRISAAILKDVLTQLAQFQKQGNGGGFHESWAERFREFGALVQTGIFHEPVEFGIAVSQEIGKGHHASVYRAVGWPDRSAKCWVTIRRRQKR